MPSDKNRTDFIQKAFDNNRILKLAFYYFVEEHNMTAEEVASACYDWELFWETVRQCWNKLIDLRR